VGRMWCCQCLEAMREMGIFLSAGGFFEVKNFRNLEKSHLNSV